MLTDDALKRYERQILLPEVAKIGQGKLKRAKVLVCGAGGLGSPVSIYLTAAGIGTLRIVDNDRVSLDNLNRQILHDYADIGKLKVRSAVETLRRLDPQVAIETISERITAHNAEALAAGVDVIVDALDNLQTRYIINEVAVKLQIPLIHGAVRGFEGRALTVVPGKSACLRCMHRDDPPVSAAKFPIIGVTAGVIGAIQATEAVKVVLGHGKLLTNRLLLYDGMELTWKEFKLRMNPSCDHCAGLQGKD